MTPAQGWHAQIKEMLKIGFPSFSLQLINKGKRISHLQMGFDSHIPKCLEAVDSQSSKSSATRLTWQWFAIHRTMKRMGEQLWRHTINHSWKVQPHLNMCLCIIITIIVNLRLSLVSNYICTITTWSNVWVILPKPSWYEFLIGFLIWTPASKYLHLTTFSNICVLLSMFLYL
jgi:hypothetical protein